MKNYDSNLDASNPCARVPVVLVLDVSSSMEGDPIAELNEGCNRFFNEVRGDEAAAMSAEISIVTFDSNARVVHGFASAYDYPDVIKPFAADGCTATGPALELAEKLLAEREELYRENGIPSYKGWVIMLTDGKPYPDTGWRDVARRFRNRADRGELTYLCVGVGDDISEETLAELSPDEPGVIRLQDLKFSAFFRWLSQSIHTVSCAGVSKQDDVRLSGIGTWARFANPRKGGVR